MEEMETAGNLVIIPCMDDMRRVKNVDLTQFSHNSEAPMNQRSLLGSKTDFLSVLNRFEEICLIFLM